jgi:hypothetical protein
MITNPTNDNKFNLFWIEFKLKLNECKQCITGMSCLLATISNGTPVKASFVIIFSKQKTMQSIEKWMKNKVLIIVIIIVKYKPKASLESCILSLSEESMI